MPQSLASIASSLRLSLFIIHDKPLPLPPTQPHSHTFVSHSPTHLLSCTHSLSLSLSHTHTHTHGHTTRVRWLSPSMGCFWKPKSNKPLQWVPGCCWVVTTVLTPRYVGWCVCVRVSVYKHLKTLGFCMCAPIYVCAFECTLC